MVPPPEWAAWISSEELERAFQSVHRMLLEQFGNGFSEGLAIRDFSLHFGRGFDFLSARYNVADHRNHPDWSLRVAVHTRDYFDPSRFYGRGREVVIDVLHEFQHWWIYERPRVRIPVDQHPTRNPYWDGPVERVGTGFRRADWMGSWDVGAGDYEGRTSRSSLYITDYEPNKRAAELLREIIPADQIKMFRMEQNKISVAVIAYGRVHEYKITGSIDSRLQDKSFTILTCNEEKTIGYCLIPQERNAIPLIDHILAVWLLITTNEIWFLRKAHVVWG